jgi:hypothetical protein
MMAITTSNSISVNAEFERFDCIFFILLISTSLFAGRNHNLPLNATSHWFGHLQGTAVCLASPNGNALFFATAFFGFNGLHAGRVRLGSNTTNRDQAKGDLR